MELKEIKLGDKKVIPLTIPSGIITTQVSSLEKLAREIPELGVLTTKSIGPKPRAGNREPILAQYMLGGFINAVGLTNPGAEEFAKELSKSHFPKDKFLLASIFGKNAEEFVYVAETLEDYVGGFELNLSCPHAKGYGMQLGQDPEIVHEITKQVINKTNKPVFAKLTPNVGNIGEIAKSAVDAGAYGIVAINTVGPGYHSVDGNPVLTNKVGGLSGIGILPIGLKCVKDIRQSIGKENLIIGMGGIRTAKDIENYADAGANIFGIGSALAGMDDESIKFYFSALAQGRGNSLEGSANVFLKNVDMDYYEFKIEKRINESCDLKLLKTNSYLDAKAGQFVFAWLPGIGEKPFSVMDNDPLTLGILERGEFTKQFNSLDRGDSFYIRGPYGRGLDVPKNSNVVLVGGGCGIAGIYLLAKEFSKKANVLTLLAAKDKDHIPYFNEFKEYGEVKVATEDGSLGKKGLITDLINQIPNESYFFNCGPRAMVDAVLPLESKVTSPDIIYSSVDYMTRCGVGICGSCANEKGRRTCLDGPFMKE